MRSTRNKEGQTKNLEKQTLKTAQAKAQLKGLSGQIK
jgi:hypothetical protein